MSAANMRGVVGVTYTSSNCNNANDVNAPQPPTRTNYNLRGHRSEVSAVKGRKCLLIPFFLLYPTPERKDPLKTPLGTNVVTVKRKIR